jgi:tetratricopeptide (TPR) repeat protein
VGGILLSAALIVRDEERFLEGCLRSLQGRVDEVVVVDTGSTDRSVEIARSFGARVIPFAWTGDFAAARNASVDASRGDWILYIDADERVVEFDRDALAPLLAGRDSYCCTVLFRPAVGYSRYREFRLFRNRPDLRFEGAIHETLVPGLRRIRARTGVPIADSAVALDHLGYEGDLTHKHRRNLPLLQARLEREPRHVYCLDQLGLTLKGLGDEAGAEDAWRRAIDVVRATGSTDLAESLAFLHLATLLVDTKRDASALLDEACQRFPQNYSLIWLQARQLLEHGSYTEAMPLFERLAAIDAAALAPAPLAFDTSIFGAQAHAALGLCAFRLGRYAESAAHYARAQALVPDDIEIRSKHAVAAMRAGAVPTPLAR